MKTSACRILVLGKVAVSTAWAPICASATLATPWLSRRASRAVRVSGGLLAPGCHPPRVSPFSLPCALSCSCTRAYAEHFFVVVGWGSWGGQVEQHISCSQLWSRRASGLVSFCVADRDECEQPSACPGQRCINTPGSYRCECKEGFAMGPRGQCEGEASRCLLSFMQS